MLELKNLKSGTDIRGVAISTDNEQSIELTDQTVTAIIRAFATWLMRKGYPDQSIVAVGRDCRLSSPRIHSAVISALNRSGMTVYDCGLCTTPAMFMTTVLTGCEAAISITASHHPFDRNGLKFFTHKGALSSKDIDKIIEIAQTHNFISVSTFGTIKPLPFLNTYAAYLRKVITCSLGVGYKAKPLEGMHFVVDAGNGMGGFYATEVLEPLGADISGSINLEPDGRFPNHTPNPEDSHAMKCVAKATIDAKADLGIIFDTDVDRAGAVGADGIEINRNRLVALASYIALENHPNGTIVTDSVTSSGLAEFIENIGGHHYRYKRGYKKVIDKAISLNKKGTVCPLAIETSGHAAFMSNYFLDDGAYLITRIIIKMAKLREKSRNITDLIRTLKEPIERAEIRLDITDDKFKERAKKVIESLEKYSKSRSDWRIAEDNREGIRVYIDKFDGWFLVRMSVHDPVMPINIESDKAGGLDAISKELLDFFKDIDGIDISPIKAKISTQI